MQTEGTRKAGKAEEVVDDWFGRLWVSLLESELSSNAKLCYGVMTSFGPSKPKLTAICRRMGKSEKVVREAQEELVKAEWIFLHREAINGERRVWMIAKERGVRPRIQGAQNDHPGSFEDGQNGHPIKASIENLNLENKQEPIPNFFEDLKTDAEAKRKQAKEEALKRKTDFTNYFQAKFLEAYKVKPDFPKFAWFWTKLQDLVDTHTFEHLCGRVDNYFTDPHVQSRSIQGFIRDPDTFLNRREKFQKGSGQGRSYLQPDVTDWKPSGGK